MRPIGISPSQFAKIMTKGKSKVNVLTMQKERIMERALMLKNLMEKPLRLQLTIIIEVKE